MNKPNIRFFVKSSILFTIAYDKCILRGKINLGVIYELFHTLHRRLR